MSFERYNGWLLLAHPHFEDQWSTLSNSVRKLAAKDPTNYRSHQKTKKLATLEKLMFEVIPQDPGHRHWMQGSALGEENRAWRGAKFGQQYRLFFRYDSSAKIIIFGWINDEKNSGPDKEKPMPT